MVRRTKLSGFNLSQNAEQNHEEALGLELVEKKHDFFQKSSELEDIPILVLSNQLELD